MTGSPATTNRWAAKSWALVVGIDRYDLADVPALTGAAADAVAAIKWLRTLGVPDAQILVNVSPSPTSKPSLDALRIPVQDATFSKIWASIYRLHQVPDGARLFIFLSGHGLYDAEDGRLFLTQEYAINSNFTANLGLDAFQDFFLSLTFAKQYLFFDGCQNYPVSPTLRSPVAAGVPPIANLTPRPENGMVACFAASQDQFALEISGRGAMLGHLLAELDLARLCGLPPHDLRHTTITYDWRTGQRTLDLRRMFLNFVQQDVTDAAAKEGRLQTPVLEVYGAAAGWPELPILELPAEPTAVLKIAVEPPQAIEAVARINISLRSPRRDYYLPLKPPLLLPDECRVPINADVEPLCYLNSATPWVIKTLPRPFAVSRPQHDAVFELERKTGAGLPPLGGAVPSDVDHFNIRLIAENGQQTTVPHDTYQQIVEQTELDMPIAARGDGVIMQPHEYGPDFVIPKNAPDSGRALVDGWARAFARLHPGNVARVAIVPPGKLLKDHWPNLEFSTPDGAEALGGFLSEQRVVFIERTSESRGSQFWRGNGDYSLGALRDLKRIRVEPGYHRIRIELPWGSWTDFVDVPHTGVAVCRLPESIGLPPLRNSVPRGLTGTLLIRDVKPGYVSSPDGETYFTDWHPLWNTDLPRSGHALSFEFRYLEAHTRFATLAWPFNRMLAIDPAGSFPRAEPYSTTPVAEWDLLVTCGRLDAIAPERLRELCRGGWASIPNRDSLLGVALAYAAHAAKAWDDLAAILVALRNLAEFIIDVALLEYAWGNRYITHRSGNRALGMQLAAREQLTLRLVAGELPVFRWGLRLARDIGGDALLVDRIGATPPTWSNWTIAFGPLPADAASEAAEMTGGADPAEELTARRERGATFETEQ